MYSKKTISRRAVLKRGLVASVTGSVAGSINGKMQLVNAALASGGNYGAIDDYRSLVCVFLYGGSDSFNMFVPLTPDRREAYEEARGVLAVPTEDILPGADDAIGFHRQLPELRRLYDHGKLSVVANVGNLIAPITRREYLQNTVPFPSDLFAHNLQQEQVQKGNPSKSVGTITSGWAGRMADVLMDANAAQVPSTYSLDGANFLLPGARTTSVALDPVDGLPLMPFLDAQSNSSNVRRDSALRQILALPRTHVMEQQFANVMTGARGLSRRMTNVLQNSPQFSSPYSPYNPLSAQLRMAARLIAAREELGQRRQVMFVATGGWDTHAAQADRLPLLMERLNNGLSEFQASIDELGVAESVTLFTSSEFGRSLSINGDGTDHGWGGNYTVMGGAVRGGDVYGKPATFELGGKEDAGEGRIIPSTAIEQYAATLAEWMGVSSSDLPEIFPDLVNHGPDWRRRLNFMS